MARTPKTGSRKAARGLMPAAAAAVTSQVLDVDIADVLETNYRNYAAAVVVGRAIPDVRDGLKPVHRRILYAMKKGGYLWDAQHRKSARICGDIMGMFHPHGDAAIYGALARLAQPWSVTAPLIDGQGNFGSPDGDAPAAMRYTEARLSTVARHLVAEIDRDTVDFQPNYDETETEPVVLPSEFPHVLVNGGSGIAVGMASSIPTHNLDEVIQATMHRMRYPDCALDELMTLLPGPDFPTGGRVLGDGGIRRAYETGRGTLDLEARHHLEEEAGAPVLVYDDMPWGVAKPAVLARINELIVGGGLPEVVSARDESGRDGTRFVVELRKGADPAAVDLRLKHLTPIRTTVSLNFTALTAQGVPREMGLAEILDHWIAFRRTTVRRRATYDLKRARARGRLMLGRIAALSVIDRIVKLIRASRDRSEAMQAIMGLSFPSADYAELIELLGTEEQKRGKRFSLNTEQAEDILAMRLQRLTGLERETLEAEAREIAARIRILREILADPARLDAEILGELEAIRTGQGRPRMTEIDPEGARVAAPVAKVLAPLEPCHVEILPDWTIRRSAQAPEAGPRIACLSTDTHSRLVIFTGRGMAYGVDVADIPDAAAKGEQARSVPGLLGVSPEGDPVAAVALSHTELAEPGEGGAILTFVSPDGMLRRTAASEFARIPQPGKIAMKIESGEPDLLTVIVERGASAGGGAVLIGTAGGKVIRFALGDIRIFGGRTSRGLRGIRLDAGDRVVTAIEVEDRPLDAETSDAWAACWGGRSKPDLPEEMIAELSASDREVVQVAASGHMKRTTLHAYRQARRDGKGVNDRGPAKAIGEIVALKVLEPGETAIFVETASGEVETVETARIKKAAKAATGTKACSSARRML